MAGVTQLFAFGDPTNVRLIGININQDDLPWWAIGILGWLGMVRSISDGYGESVGQYKALLKHTIDKGRPEDIYPLYKKFKVYEDAVADGKIK